MRINSIISSIQQQARITETEKDKEKEKDREKLRPIMSYYIINNHIYPNNFNTQQNPKLIIHKKKGNLSISNFNNLNININTNPNSKRHLSKNNSTLSSYNPLSSKIPFKQYLNTKLSQENAITINNKYSTNSKKDLTNGKHPKKFNKKIKIDSNLLMKKINKQNNLKSTNDIFYNDNSYSLNTEFRKKNKKNVITTLNNSKNTSIEKIKIISKNNINNNNNKLLTKENDINISNNKTAVKRKLTKKNSAKLIKSELFYQNYKKKGFDMFMNYIKGVNKIKNNNNFIATSSSCKSITNFGNNISNRKSKIKINISELKHEFINKELKNNLISKQSSIKVSNKYTQSKSNQSARMLSIKAKNKKGKIILNKLHLDLNTKRSKKNMEIINKTNLDNHQLDSPYNKVFQKTGGNYFSPNEKNTNGNVQF